MAIRNIILRGDPNITEEFKAAEAITPGHLLDFDGSGDLIKHAGAGLSHGGLIALERSEEGRTVTSAYAVGEFVKVAYMRQGDVYAMIGLSGENLEPGDFVDSDGAGRVKEVDASAATADTARGSRVGVIINSHGALGADTLIRVKAG